MLLKGNTMNSRCLFLALVLSVASLALAMPSHAQTTWYVDDDAPNDPGPGDPSVSDQLEDGSVEHPFDAIQEGLNVALSGDNVQVADGTYCGVGNRDLDYFGKEIILQSENGSENCVIEVEDPAVPCFFFHTDEGPGSIVRGFTIQYRLYALWVKRNTV